jgi:hypothetical protein
LSQNSSTEAGYDSTLILSEAAIRKANIVIPKAFCEKHRGEIDWDHFDVVVLDRRIAGRKLDRQRRLGVPLRGVVFAGQSLTLHVKNRELHIVKETELSSRRVL